MYRVRSSEISESWQSYILHTEWEVQKFLNLDSRIYYIRSEKFRNFWILKVVYIIYGVRSSEISESWQSYILYTEWEVQKFLNLDSCIYYIWSEKFRNFWILKVVYVIYGVRSSEISESWKSYMYLFIVYFSCCHVSLPRIINIRSKE